MDAQLRHLLKPEILNTVNGLELVARIIVEGFMSGSNKSQTIGAGQEFSQYRGYEPGDDLRQLDWKMFARTERYYIKLAEIETNITVKFILDASRSMAYEEEGISKLMYAKMMIAALAYLARKQSDTFGLYAVNNQRMDVIEPRFEQQQFMRFLHQLIAVKSEGQWSKPAATDRLLAHHGREMIVFFSDLYDDAHDLHQFISRMKTSRNEVIVFHLLGEKEKSLAFDGVFTFEDLEAGVRLEADTRTQQKTYTQQVERWLKENRSWMLEKQINYVECSIGLSPATILRQFLTVRKTLNS